MKIAFADFSGWDYHAQTVDEKPMGGTQSAVCYLSRAMATAGHEVSLIGAVRSQVSMAVCDPFQGKWPVIPIFGP